MVASTARPVIRNLVAVQIGAFALLSLVLLVPDRAVLDQIIEDADAGVIELEDDPFERSGQRSDRFGECVLLTIGVTDTPMGWIDRAATSPTLGQCSLLGARVAAYEAGEEFSSRPKIRYWNGLGGVARPLLPLVGVAGVRLLGMLVLVGGSVALALVVSRARGGLSSMLLIGPLLVSGGVVTLLDTFHHSAMLGVAFGGSAYLAKRAGDGASPERLLVAGVTVGAVYNVVDLLNFVPGVWVLSFGAAALVVPEVRTARRSLAAIGVGWLAGYGLTWLGRWAIAALVTTPRAVWDEITGQISYRLDGSDEVAQGGFGTGLREVLGKWLDQPGGPAVVSVLLVAGIWLAIRALRRGRTGRLTVAIGGAAMVVPWFLLANNHHVNHDWFEFRSLPIIAGVLLASAFVDGVLEPEPDPVA